jgi:membrane protease YdiL (CAAX protease family)
MIIQTLINSIFQLLLFSLIPFIWWVIFWRKKEKFLPWIGIKKPVIKNKRLVYGGGCLFLMVSMLSNIYVDFVGVVETSETAVGQFQGLGIAALFSALLYGMIQTGATEEIFFGGFWLNDS